MSLIQPLVFLPGLMGSMSNKIVPGTGGWSFGPAALVYEKFIMILENMGYKKDENLFICYYNWKQSCSDNVEEYLKQTIEKAKKTTNAKKVDIVAHSLGGLVVRSYICSEAYNDDIDKLILLSCPNTGAADAYYLWSEGKLPDREGVDSYLLNVVIEGYLHILKRHHNINSIKELIQKEFGSIKEILPSYGYGNYLFYLDSQDIMRYLSYNQLKYKNEFLDELNQDYKVYRKKGISIYLIAGAGKATNKSLQVENNIFDKSGNVANNGTISNQIRTYEGDGTVLVRSALDMVGIKYVVQATHTDVLLESEKIIRQILISDYRRVRRFSTTQKDIISIVVFGRGRFRIKMNEKYHIVQRNFHMKDIYYHEYNNTMWLVVEKEKNTHIAVYYDAYSNEKIDVLISHKNEMKREKVKTYRQRQYRILED